MRKPASMFSYLPRFVAGAVAIFLLTMAGSAVAKQPSDKYPDGVQSVIHGAIYAGAEWQVDVVLEEGVQADAVAVYICRFAAAADGDPDLCYPPLGAKGTAPTFTANTGDSKNLPDWTEGMSLGYKVRVVMGDGHLSAPSDGGYYRVQVAAAPEVQSVEENVPGEAIHEDAAGVTAWPILVVALFAWHCRRR